MLPLIVSKVFDGVT